MYSVYQESSARDPKERPTMTMKILALCISYVALCADAYSTSVEKVAMSRRSILGSAISAATAITFGSAATVAAADDETDVYFGVGCFWHIQHEFVDAERKLLGRGDHQLTSRAGYAGGTKTGSEGRVCYHNFQGLADYGKLGHGEVVGMRLPEKSIGEFAKVYFSLFAPNGGKLHRTASVAGDNVLLLLSLWIMFSSLKDSLLRLFSTERVDPGDRGSEYR